MRTTALIVLAGTAEKSAIHLRPDYAEAGLMLGTDLKQKGDLPQAADALRQAARFNLYDPGPYNTLAQGLHAESGEIGSKEAFERGAEVKKRIEARQAAVFSLTAGMQSFARGDLPAAEKQFRQAIAAAPDAAKAHRRLADVLRKRGQVAVADHELRAAENQEQRP